MVRMPRSRTLALASPRIVLVLLATADAGIASAGAVPARGTEVEGMPDPVNRGDGEFGGKDNCFRA